MKLVADAHRWWRWHSTYVFAVLALFPAVWLSSADLQALLPPKVVSAIAPAVGVIGFLVRIRKQAESLPPVKEEPKDGDHQ
jgi:hypothetical protein